MCFAWMPAQMCRLSFSLYGNGEPADLHFATNKQNVLFSYYTPCSTLPTKRGNREHCQVITGEWSQVHFYIFPNLDIVLWPYTVHCTYIVYHPIRTEIVSHNSRSKEPAFPPLFATSLSSHRRCWPHSQRVDSHECFTFALPHFKIISSSTRLYSCSWFNQILH